MNTLFVFDIKYLKYKNEYYTTADLQYEKLKEYINYFGKITVLTRCIQVEKLDLNKVKIASGDNVNFFSIYTKGIAKIFTKGTYRILYDNIKKSDFVIIRLPSFLGIIAYSIVKKFEKPYLIELVSCPWDSLWNYGSIKGKIIAPIMYIMTKIIIKNAKYVHYVSENFLQKRYPTNGYQLACSDVIIDDIDQKVLENRLSNINSKKDNKYIFGVVGSLNVNYKGHEIAIKALSLLKDKINFELHFLGNGEKNRWIRLAKKYKIEDKVFFDDTLPSGKPVFNWLDKLNIHLMMSKAESHGRVLLEAMSRASISIGSNVGGIPELISKKYIVDKNDYNQLANKILEIISNKELQINISIENFNMVKKFEKRKLYEKMQEFYNIIKIKENLINK